MRDFQWDLNSSSPVHLGTSRVSTTKESRPQGPRYTKRGTSGISVGVLPDGKREMKEPDLRQVSSRLSKELRGSLWPSTRNSVSQEEVSRKRTRDPPVLS